VTLTSDSSDYSSTSSSDGSANAQAVWGTIALVITLTVAFFVTVVLIARMYRPVARPLQPLAYVTAQPSGYARPVGGGLPTSERAQLKAAPGSGLTAVGL
jgi:hypothetical protein